MIPGQAPAAGGTVVLDSEGLAAAVRRDEGLQALLAGAVAEDMRVVTSATTLVEVMHPGMKRAALDWTLSRIVVEPVTEKLAKQAAVLLQQAGRHGHSHALDAMLCAVALAGDPPVYVVTSNPEDIGVLCGSRVKILKI